jgi:hypothetical protein
VVLVVIHTADDALIVNVVVIAIDLNGVIDVFIVTVLQLHDVVGIAVLVVVVLTSGLDIHSVILRYVVLSAVAAIGIDITVFNAALADHLVFPRARPVAVTLTHTDTAAGAFLALLIG